jgi:hypothetical protein
MAVTGNRREAAAFALARGQTVKQAALEVGVGERTLHRWLKADAAFPRRVGEYRDQLVSGAVGRLSDLAGRAAETLGELVVSKDDKVRLQAVRTVFEALSAREAADVAARMSAIERAYTERSSHEESIAESASTAGPAGGARDSDAGDPGTRARAAAAW